MAEKRAPTLADSFILQQSDQSNILVTVETAEHIKRQLKTRARRFTRHGRGPFPGVKTGMRFYDDTNVYNDWQEGLRFGEVNPTLLKETIDQDLKNTTLSVVKRLAVTHLDQCGDVNFADKLARYVGADGLYVSEGSTRADVVTIA